MGSTDAPIKETNIDYSKHYVLWDSANKQGVLPNGKIEKNSTTWERAWKKVGIKNALLTINDNLKTKWATQGITLLK